MSRLACLVPGRRGAVARPGLVVSTGPAADSARPDRAQAGRAAAPARPAPCTASWAVQEQAAPSGVSFWRQSPPRPLATLLRPLRPRTSLWGALLPADRERVARWVQAPAAPERQLEMGDAGGARLVADVLAERRPAMRLRVLRDAGSLVAPALTGAAVAVHAAPPISWNLAGVAVAWLLALTLLARHAARRARGQGVLGTPDGNALYHANPERFALGGVYSVSLGAGLGMAAMLAKLIANAF